MSHPLTTARTFEQSTPRVTSLLLRKIIFRAWRQSPRQTLLLLAVLSLGVAVFVSVRLANRAAVSSFAHFTDSLTGQSDWIVQPYAGSLNESVLLELRSVLGTRPVHIVPVIEVATVSPALNPSGDATVPGAEVSKRESFTLLGIDLVGILNLPGAGDRPKSFFGHNSSSGTPDAKDAFWTSLHAGSQAWVSSALARRIGSKLDIVLDDKVVSLSIAGAIPQAEGMPSVPESLVVLDLPELQTLSGRKGQLSRVEFVVEPGPGADTRREELKQLLIKTGSDRWSVESPGTRRETAETMTRAFRLNLTVLSLIALLVGLYLIFQTLDGAVVRRRGEIAILRSLGVPESIVRRVWLAEALVLGSLGSIMGILGGWAGAQISVRSVARTVNALYYSTTVSSAHLAWQEAALALAVGLIASLVAGWWPAREAARTPPAQLLVRHSSSGLGHPVRHTLIGLSLIAIGVVLIQLPPLRFSGGGRFALAGYIAAFCWIAGGGILCGAVLPVWSLTGRSLANRAATVRIALSHLRQPSSRHRFAVAALLCAIGMSAGMAILVASFELTVRGWIQTSLQADLYIANAGTRNASARSTLSPEIWQAITSHPAVATWSVINNRPVVIDDLATELGGADLRKAGKILTWITAPQEPTIYDPAQNAGLALASESFCERFRRRPGDTVTLPTPAGVKSIRLVGIFADYGNERGSLLVDRTHLRDWFNDDRVTNVSLALKDGASLSSVRAELLQRHPGLSIFENSALRREILRVFRQTFSITYALEIIGVFVAVAGLGMTLASVLLDRREELTTLRALGFSRREIARALAIEGGAIAAAGVAGGLATSVALGWLLIHVINKQSFGWTLGYATPWLQLAALAAAVVSTGTIVSYFVGRWGAALPADREE